MDQTKKDLLQRGRERNEDDAARTMSGRALKFGGGAAPRVTEDTLKCDARYCNEEKTRGERIEDGMNSGCCSFPGKAWVKERHRPPG